MKSPMWTFPGIALVAALVALQPAHAATGNITTFAGGGSGVPPGPSVPATSVALDFPRAVTFDAAGNFYFPSGGSTATNRRIHKVSGGLITTLLDNAGDPIGMVADAAGNVFYCDTANHYVKKVDTSGAVTIVAGTGTAGFGGDNGPATAAMLNRPFGIALDGANLLITDGANYRVRRISGGTIVTAAGDGTFGYAGDGGPALLAKLSAPTAIVADGAGGFFFGDVVGTLGGRVRHVDAGGVIRLLPGTADIDMSSPGGLARDAAGNVYVAVGYRVYRIDPAGTRTTAAGGVQPPGGTSIGDGGPATSAFLSGALGVAFSPSGELYIADAGNNRIRKVDPAGIITTVAGGSPYVGDGAPAANAVFTFPIGVSVDATGAVLIADSGGQRVRRVDAAGITSTFAGTGTYGFSGDGGPATSAMLGEPSHAFKAGDSTYIADYFNRRIRRVDAAGAITTFAGTGPSGLFGFPNFGGDRGPASSAKLSLPSSIAFDGVGNLYFVDAGNARVRKIGLDGVIDTVAGNGTTSYNGDGILAVRAGISPRHIALDAAGNLYISDNCRVRKVDAQGLISTAAGTTPCGFSGDSGPAVAARLSGALGLAFDPSGNLYIADRGNERIRMVSPDGRIETVAGTGVAGFSGDGGPATAATLRTPQGLAWHASQSALLVADSANDRIRKIAVVDTTPAAFQFAAQSGVALSSVVQSAVATPAAYDAATPVSVSGGEYSLGCTDTFTSTAGTITPGQTVCVRHTASALNNASTTTTLTIGGIKADFVSTTLVGAGTLNVSPASIDFGTPWLNNPPAAQTVTLTNAGATPVTVHSITTPFPFTVTHNCTTLAAGATCTAQAGFTPTLPGVQTGALTIQATPGTQSVALAGAGSTSLTRHYYESILRRSPDAPGQAFWDGEAARIAATGANVNETWFALAMQFYFSPEYVALARDNVGFVTDLYLTFFNRAPDSGGLAYWTGQLAQGMPREVLLAAFMFSSEFAAFASNIFGNSQARTEVDMVMDFYRGLLARLPDNTGQAFWVGRFRAAQCSGATAVTNEADAISRNFVESSEYLARNRTNSQYVGDLYNAFLRRGGDLGGVNYWIGVLDNQTLTREAVRIEFYRSFEFSRRVNRVVAQGCQS